MEMHHPNSPSRKDLFPSLRKYGQQTATAISYFRISLSNRDHPGKKACPSVTSPLKKTVFSTLEAYSVNF